MQKKYDVSIVVAQYNPDCGLLIKTIKSIIEQKNVRIQIIIADDGSKVDYFNIIENYLKKHGFYDYKFTKCDINSGTCINVRNAVEIADGEYVKLISPGDYLYEENTLHNWYKFCKKHNVIISYGTAIYYQEKNRKMQIIQKRCTQPALNYLYKIENDDLKGKVVDNLVLCDCILGASYLCERRILEIYMNEICGRIKFCEDFSYRLMLLDGQRIVWYEKPVIYYSYGDGISSKSDSDGSPMLKRDEIEFDKLISQRKMKSNIGRKLQKFSRKKRESSIEDRLLSFIYFPKALYYRFVRLILIKMGRTRTCQNVNNAFMKCIQREEVEKNNAGD